MDDLIVILLKSIIGLGLLFVMGMVFKTYVDLKWNRLLYNKQKEHGEIVLEPINYKPRIGGLVAVIVVMMIVVNAPSGLIDNLSGFMMLADQSPYSTEENIIDLMNQVEYENGDIYIVQVRTLNDIESYNILYNTVDDEIVDYYNYEVSMVDQLYGSSTLTGVTSMITTGNTAITFELTEDLEYSYLKSVPLSTQKVYLVIGGFVDDSNNEFSDNRLNEGEFIFTWEVILLEGYDVSKELNEQTQEIQDIVYEYTQHLDE